MKKLLFSLEKQIAQQKNKLFDPIFFKIYDRQNITKMLSEPIYSYITFKTALLSTI